jgi:hypothetical protein
MSDDVHKEIVELKEKVQKVADGLESVGDSVSRELGALIGNSLGTLNRRLTDIAARVRKLEEKLGIPN